MIVAVVPVSDLALAKQRLAPVLPEVERAGLTRAMLIDVLSALARASGIDRVHVVARDPEILETARTYGAALIPEAENRGHNEAVAMAVTHLAGRDLTAILAVPADVPMIQPSEIEALARPVLGPLVRLAPARDGDGTNGLLLSPPGVIATHYGPGSAARHRRAANDAGVPCEELHLPGIGLDLDTPRDLAEFCAIPSDTRSHAYLEEKGIVERLLEASGV